MHILCLLVPHTEGALKTDFKRPEYLEDQLHFPSPEATQRKPDTSTRPKSTVSQQTRKKPSPTKHKTPDGSRSREEKKADGKQLDGGRRHEPTE